MDHAFCRKSVCIKIISFSIHRTDPFRHPASILVRIVVSDPGILLKFPGCFIEIISLFSHIDPAGPFLITAIQIKCFIIFRKKSRCSLFSGLFSVLSHIPGSDPAVFLHLAILIQITVFHPASSGQKAFFVKIIGFVFYRHKTFLHPPGLLIQIISLISQLQPALMHGTIIICIVIRTDPAVGQKNAPGIKIVFFSFYCPPACQGSSVYAVKIIFLRTDPDPASLFLSCFRVKIIPPPSLDHQA